jgi:SNF2 family DNA or RNA helicase
VTYIDFIIEKTIEVKIIKALRAKINLAEAVLGEGGREWLL